MLIRTARADDLDAVVGLAHDAQRDPQRFCAYLADDRASMAVDITGVDGPDGAAWYEVTWLALDDERNVVAWLLADTDPDMGRIWWWGPIVAAADRLAVDLRDQVIDQLLATATRALGEYEEHELAIDVRSELLSSAATRHGFIADEASAVLRTEPFVASMVPGDDDVAPIDADDRDAVIALHDELFPGTHTTGRKLVESAEGKFRLALRMADQVAGYVATEIQSDGSLYIDYLGVEPGHRNRGIGRRLVAEAMRRGAAAGATHADLTVRIGNTTARSLYAALGFVEERVLVPYRRGFTLE